MKELDSMAVTRDRLSVSRIAASIAAHKGWTILAVACIAAIIAATSIGHLMVDRLASNAVKRNAEQLSISWANYLKTTMPGLESILAGAPPSDEQMIYIRQLKAYSSIFHFKLYDETGRTIYSSLDSGNGLETAGLASHNADAARAIQTERPYTEFHDGTQKPNRPDVYAESYIPILRDGKIIGVAEAYVDQSENALAIHASFTRFQIAFGLMLLLAAIVPIGAVAYALRNLQHKNAELKLARDRALLAEKAKSEFLATMSHEIRTPMNGVMGTAELMAGTNLDHRQQMFMDIIQTSSASLMDIINDILDFSKIDADQITMVKEPFKLSRLAAEPAGLVTHAAAEKNVELTIRVDPSAPRYVIGDVDRLRQVVVNLVGNAVKFTDTGTVTIDVSVHEEDGDLTLKVEVRDTGIGIPADEIGTIFDRFSQVDSSSTRTHQGTGLGLAISKGLIEKMGGQIGVTSTVGAGSTFQFTVPVGRHHDTGDKKATLVELSGRRILVIDDNATNRFIFQEMLTAWGFDTTIVSSGRDGVQAAMSAAMVKKPFDIVLLDHHMPGMDGEDVLRALRNSEDCADIPVIILTSILETSSLERCHKELGLNGCMTKPAASSPLMDMIANVVSDAARKKAETDPDTISDAAEPQMLHIEEVHSEDTESKPAAASQQNDFDGSGQLDVLIVEDNAVNQMLVEHILQSMNLNFTCAPDGKEAVASFRRHKPRMIVMDVSMPIMNGYQATEAIRAIEEQEGLPRTPIIGTTAHAMSGDKQKCLDAGMDDYISKPLSVKALTLMVSQWIETESVPKAMAG